MENTPNTQNGYRECPVFPFLSVHSLFTFSTQRFNDGYDFKGETHDFYEVVCVTDGKVGITADKNVYVLDAGQMILHPPGEFHAIWSDRGASSETVIFSFRADPFPEQKKRVFRLSRERLNEIKSIFRAAEDAFRMEAHCVVAIKDGKAACAAAVVKRLEVFLLDVFEDGKNDENAAKYTGRSAENYIRILSVIENGLSEPLNASTIAELCNMSLPAVEKTVFRFAGCGVMAYYNGLRMQRAAELLSSGASVKEAAISVGFSDQNYFSARFKKWSGAPPSAWKK